MEYKNLLIDTKDHIAIVTINRPDKLNALNNLTLIELKAVFDEIKNNPDLYVVIITGSGEKAFVAGADISEINKLDVISGKEFAELGQNVFASIENFNKPVIAAVNGFALGGGCELALACHIRYASENAKFGQPEINLGIIPGYGGTQRLSKQINSGRAMEMILTGDLIDSSEALRLGLINKIFPSADLMSKVWELAEKISKKPQQTVKYILQAVNSSNEVSLEDGQLIEATLFALCCGTDDFKEGTKAFLEKRKPVFTNK